MASNSIWRSAAVDPLLRARIVFFLCRPKTASKQPVLSPQDGELFLDLHHPFSVGRGGVSMCGICGIVAQDPRADITASIDALMTALEHRGPDGSGIHWLRRYSAAMGHRRLAIVDLEGGAQPMANEAGNLWVVFNGEIYNHLDLRRELEAGEHRFASRADSEVLVHGFEQWGIDLFPRLNGMYAFAIFDSRKGRDDLWLVRDPVGIKPLYLGRTDAAWWFSSELPAVAKAGLLDTELRAEAFGEYLVYRFVPSPGTFYRRVWKIPPGHSCRLSLHDLPEKPSLQRFQSRFAPATLPRGEGEWCEALRHALRQAVQRQLMADVPVGVLLSGGVDSTVVTQIMHMASGSPPQAFAIGFSDSADGGELPVARRAASALGVPLSELAVQESEFVAAWPQQIAAMGEPIANSGTLLMALLCKLVRHTHKVVLACQGADEPLGGYARHAVERLLPALHRMSSLLKPLPEALAASDRISRTRRIAAEPDEARRFAETLAIFGLEESVAMTTYPVESDSLADPVRRWLGHTTGDSFNRLLQIDSRLSLADDLLNVADQMSMASSVELRVPFLDLEFLALVEQMPARFKVSLLGERKWLYRKAVRPLLPAEVRAGLTGWQARTGRKYGFSTPLDRWYPTWLYRDAESFLLGHESRTKDYLNGDRVRTLIEDARDRQRPRIRQLLTIYVLEVWLRAQGSCGSSCENGYEQLSRIGQ